MLGLTGKEAHQVNAVRVLLDEHAPRAVLHPPPRPARQAPDAHGDHQAERHAGQGRPRLLNRRAVARLVADAADYPGLGDVRGDLPPDSAVHRYRLLDEERLAGVQDGVVNVAMRERRQRDVHGIEVHGGEHVPHVGKGPRRLLPDQARSRSVRLALQQLFDGPGTP